LGLAKPFSFWTNLRDNIRWLDVDNYFSCQAGEIFGKLKTRKTVSATALEILFLVGMAVPEYG